MANINISKNVDSSNDKVQYIVSSTIGRSKEELIIDEESKNWSTEGIINFLLAVVDEGEELNVTYDQAETDEKLKVLAKLFEDFANEFKNEEM